MGTEKFIAFKEDGTAYRLKGRILRFLDNEPVSEADKTNIRSTLSVPASAEGLTPANNLSDLDSAATARTNLSVNSIDEDAQANGTKVTAPALYFDGSNDYVQVADSDLLSFTDGTDDLPFSVSAFVKMTDATDFNVVSKFGAGNSTREWMATVQQNDDIRFYVQDTSGNYALIQSSDALTGYEGEWVHLAWTYAGAGPNSANAFTAAMDGVSLFVNGEAVSLDTATYSGTYTGMSNTSQPLHIGRKDTSYAKGSIRDCKIFNRELTADEIAELARGNDLGFSEEFGGALGAVYTQDATPSGEWTGSAGTSADEAGPIGGRSNVLKFTNDGVSSQHLVENNAIGTTVGKRYRVEFDYFIPAGQSNIDGLDVNDRLALGAVGTVSSATLGAWTRFSGEYVATNNKLGINALDGGVASYQDAGSDDVFYIDGLTVTQIGTLADFRAEDYNESASKLLDRSSNNFVGVGTGVTLVGNQRHISADTIDLKNLPTSSAGLSAGEVWSNGGVLTVV